MTSITDINLIQEISQSLSNENRLKIIYILKDGNAKTLRELYDLSRDMIGLEHRETLYKYVESLVSVNLLKKSESENGVSYLLAQKTITFDFQALHY